MTFLMQQRKQSPEGETSTGGEAASEQVQTAGSEGRGEEGGPKAGSEKSAAEKLAALEERNKHLESENDRAKRYLVGLVKRVEELSTTQAEPDPDEEEKIVESFKKRFEENPLAALDEHFTARMRPVHEDNLTRAAQVVKDAEVAEIVQKYGAKKWEKYKEEVDKFMAPMSAKVKADRGSWLHAFKMVLSDHFDDEVAERVRMATTHEDTAEVEGANGSSAGRARTSFSQMEKAIMNEFGMDEKEWLKYGGGKESPYFSNPTEEK